MRRFSIVLLAATAIPFFALGAAGTQQTWGTLGSTDGHLEARKLNQFLVHRLDSELQPNEPTPGGLAATVIEITPGCTSNGTLDISSLGGSMLGFASTGIAPERFAAVVGGPPSTVPIPFGGGVLCEVPFNLFHYFPKQTTALGEFNEAYFVDVPEGGDYTVSFQVMYRQPDQSWHLNTSDSVRVKFAAL